MKRWISAILVLTMLLCLLPAAASAASGDKLIAVTFDDGPGAYTTRLLDGLRARGAQCTFFLVGTGVEARPEVVRQIWMDGHQIATHTYNHPSLTSLTDEQIRSQLSKCYGLMNKAVGFELSYMLRPPYGSYNTRVLNAVNTPCFYWSVDTRDWESRNADAVYNQFIKSAKDGSIVLLHDIHSTSVDGALRAIDTLQAQGYEFVTVSELFYRRGISLENAKIYFSAYPGSAGTADAIADPVISSAVRDGVMQVTIQGDSRGKVYYTTNGEAPTPANSRCYTGPFAVAGNVTVRAESVLNWNGLRSDVKTAEIRFNPAARPALAIEQNTLTMTCATKDATIYYTADGTAPTQASAKYAGSLAATPGTTYRAVAYAQAYDPSPEAMLTYTTNGFVLGDVSVKAWYYPQVDEMMAAGLIKGVAEQKFAPETMLTRAMLVALLYRIHGSPVASAQEAPFDDVPGDMWCRDAVAWAADSGIVKGYGDGTFRPRMDLTRQELCAMVARYLRYAGKSVDGVESGALDRFSDRAAVRESFAADVDLVCALGIVNGFPDGTIRPEAGATRAQSAVMLSRMLDNMSILPDLPAAPEPEQPDEDQRA